MVLAGYTVGGNTSSISILNSLVPWVRELLLEYSLSPWALTEELIKVNRPKKKKISFLPIFSVYIMMFQVEDEFLEVFMLP